MKNEINQWTNDELKTNLSKIISEKKIIKTKNNKNLTFLQNLEQIIENVEKNRKPNEPILTTNQKQINLLVDELKILKEVKNSKKEILLEKYNKSNYWYIKELKLEILELFKEEKRLLNNNNQNEKELKQIENFINEIEYLIENSRINFSSNLSYIKDIEYQIETYLTYIKGKEKNINKEILNKINNNFSLINNEINNIKIEIENLKLENNNLNEKEIQNKKEKDQIENELNLIIENQLKLIKF